MIARKEPSMIDQVSCFDHNSRQHSCSSATSSRVGVGGSNVMTVKQSGVWYLAE